MMKNYSYQHETLSQFHNQLTMMKQIIQDEEISTQWLEKYLKWSKGDLQQALNYYYHRKQKQNKKDNQVNHSQLKEQKIIKQQQDNNTSVFTKMKQASKKQQQKIQFITKIRKQYQLPITKKSNKKAINTYEEKNKSQQEEQQNQIQEQFRDVDYLPDMFNKAQRDDQENIPTASDSRTKTIKMQQQRNKNINLIDEINQIHQQEAINKSSNKLKIQQIQGEELYLGNFIMDAFATDIRVMTDCPINTPIQMKHYIAEEKKKKGGKGFKKVEVSMNIRIFFKQKQLGRVKDHQVRIILPLIDRKIIRVETYMCDCPLRVDKFTKIRLRCQVFLLKKAITKPIVQTCQRVQDIFLNLYKGLAEQISTLLTRLNLKVLTYPLIRAKKPKKLANSINSSFKDQEQQSKSILQTEYKSDQQLIKQSQNPFLKSTQKNITEMIKNLKQQRKSSLQNISKNRKINTNEEQVIKQVISIESLQLDENKLFQLININQQNLQSVQVSQNFITKLYDYQLIALSWMLQRQGKIQHKNKKQLHPLWTQYSLNDKYILYFNEMTGQLSMQIPTINHKCRGGILADQMGLGKTVMMSALIASNRTINPQKKFLSTRNKKTSKYAHNLIIVPLTLMNQWQNQLKKHTKKLTILQYYSTQRSKYVNVLHNYDIIITTYGTISHQYSKELHLSFEGLYSYNWQRIVLDQAHYIKGRVIQTAKSVYNLQGLCRWCLTGTPIQNNLTDIFSLIHFLRYIPWSQYECWQKYITRPFQQSDPNVYEILKSLLSRIFLRRTKNTRNSQGQLIIKLPEKISQVQILTMNQKQRQFYDRLYDNNKQQFDELDKLGILNSKYMQILELLLRLRQVCCHPILFKSVKNYVNNFNDFEKGLKKFLHKRQEINLKNNQQVYYEPIFQGQQEIRIQSNSISNSHVNEQFLKKVLQTIKNNQIDNCLICLNQCQQPVITVCLHIFCRTCLIVQIQQLHTCAICRHILNRQDYLHLPRQNRFAMQFHNKDGSQSGIFKSTKIKALMQHLLKMNTDDKAVVFSQFLGMLDLIQYELKNSQIPYTRMQGCNTLKQRQKIINSFQNDDKIKIFVVSLKTAGVGLNLVAANRIFLMDPWWNPAVQEQAIQRVHRIGQTKKVSVIRFIMDRTIQMRMLELNTQKNQLAQNALSHQQYSQSTEQRVQKLRYLMQKY